MELGGIEATAHRGGLQLSSPIPILGRAALAWGRSWGCLSLLELQRECKGRISGNPAGDKNLLDSSGPEWVQGPGIGINST